MIKELKDVLESKRIIFELDRFIRELQKRLSQDIWVGGDGESGMDFFDKLSNYDQGFKLGELIQSMIEYFQNNEGKLDKKELENKLDEVQIIAHRNNDEQDSTYVNFTELCPCLVSFCMEKEDDVEQARRLMNQ